MKVFRNGIEIYDGPAEGAPGLNGGFKQPERQARSMDEQHRILTVICPACPHGMWTPGHCAACPGGRCFGARVANAAQHCPRGEW